MSVPVFYLPNLSSVVTEQGNPWELEFKLPSFETSLAYKKWATLPETKYCAFSLYEGLDGNLRISKSNPAYRMHGFVADYDAKLTDQEYQDFVKRSLDTDFPVSHVSRSYGGGIHAVWLFDEPINVHGPKSQAAFLVRLGLELRLKTLTRGLDENAAKTPNKYYLHGFQWKPVSTERIPKNFLALWQYETSMPADFELLGAEIELDIIHKEVERQFPGRWSGPFADGARGVRFWDPDGTNPTAAAIRETGVQDFAGPQPFLTWGEILGRSFVQKHQAGKLGEVAAKFWYDGKDFWFEESSDKLLHMSRQDATLFLKVSYGLRSTKKKKEAASELEQTLNMIVMEKRVEAALPFVHRYDKLINQDGKIYCNTSSTRCMEPRVEPCAKWGDGFEALGQWLEEMLGPEQLSFFIAWAHRSYKYSYEGQPRTGHAMIVAGPPNCGKTLLSTCVMAPILGGHAPASAFLQGDSGFNRVLFDYGLWTVDDGIPAREHEKFTSSVKDYVVNPRFPVREKYLKDGQVSWKGRIFITTNLDVRSIRMIPDLDMSVKDKLLVFRAALPKTPFSEERITEIQKGLSAFCRYLLDYRIPTELLGDTRFGLKHYINEEIDRLTQADSKFVGVVELLELFRAEYFGEDQDTPFWEGTSTGLIRHLGAMSDASCVLRDINARKLGWGLRHLRDIRCPWITCKIVSNVSIWKIHSPHAQQTT